MRGFKGKEKIIAVLCAICLICVIFGGCTNNETEKALPDTSSQYGAVSVETETGAFAETEAGTDEVSKSSPAEEIKKEEPQKRGEREPEKEEADVEELKCTLSVDCSKAVLELGEKSSFLPEDGKLFKETEVSFSEGESVFDVLLREMRKSGIHLEFVDVPLYNSVYIEGIGNLYEFDCGELSGWTYRVNGVFPNCGASVYKLQNGDCVEWIYTCDLGRDIGDENSVRN